GGRAATVLGTTTLPMVGTEKLIAGDMGVTTTTRGASAVSSVATSFLDVSVTGGWGNGWMTMATGSSNGGTGLGNGSLGRTPDTATSRKRKQIELTQASTRSGWPSGRGRQTRARS